MMFLYIGNGGSPPPPPGVAWNPSDAGTNLAFANGNRTVYKASGDAYSAVRATQGRAATDAGGHYFEVLVVGSASSTFIAIGVATTSQVLNNYIGSGADGWGYYQQTGTKLHNGAGTAYGASYTTGDVIGVLLKNGKVYFRKNGTWQNSGDPGAETGEAFSGLTGTLYPAVAVYRATNPRHELTGRFKASDFSGSIPSGVAAWEA